MVANATYLLQEGCQTRGDVAERNVVWNDSVLVPQGNSESRLEWLGRPRVRELVHGWPWSADRTVVTAEELGWWERPKL